MIGVVLTVGITMIGVTGILLFGATGLKSAQTRSEIDAAEHVMTQLDSRFSLVALGSSEYQGASVPLRSGASLTVNGDSGWMNVSVVNQSDDSIEFVVLNETLGALVYENDGTSIAYQGGGVWKRAESGGSTMVSPPEFHYRAHTGSDPTLTLPLVVVRGSGSISRKAVVEAAGTTSKYPTSGRSNPLERGQVNITIQSSYYQAWGRFFEDRTDGAVTYDHDRERVSVTLRIQESAPGISGGIVSGEGGSALTFEDQAEADSYNSSEGDYGTTSAENTSVVAAGSVELHNQATLFGDLVAGGSVTLQNKAEITGNVSYSGSLSNGGTIGGWTRNRADVPVLNAVNWLIDEKRETFESSNNNSAAGAIDASSDTLTGCSPSCTVHKGDYILQNVSLGNGEELVLDTSGGEIEVAVREGVALEGDGKIRVTGGGTARFYVEGDLTAQNEGNLTVSDHRSPGLWLYMNPGADATFQDQSRLVGVIYGPASAAQSGVDITFINQAKVFGGLVGSVDSIPNGIGIHFDEALTSEDPLAGAGGDRPPVTYMHVTVNAVNVSSQ